MERRDLQLMVQRPEGMLVEGLRRGCRIPVPEGVRDALRREAVGKCDAAPLMAEIEVRRPIEEAVAMQDRQGAPDGARVALRDGAVPQELGRVVRAEAEKLREQFE